MKDLTLSEIWIYPVKGLGGIKLTSAKVMEKGLVHDRRWMLVDEHHVCMTQRVYPTMALFQLSIAKDQICISRTNLHGEKTSVCFNVGDSPREESILAKIFDDEVVVHEVNPKISEWFSDHLKTHCKLVRFPEKNSRPVDLLYQVNNEHVSLADAYPFLIIGQRSLDELNSRLAQPLPMNRFRPNLVYTGGTPFEEDSWKNFSIGKNRFVGVKPCARCVVPTVDQQTGEKGTEPLITLSTFRKRNSKVYFGQNLVAIDHGEVSIGDKITVN